MKVMNYKVRKAKERGKEVRGVYFKGKMITNRVLESAGFLERYAMEKYEQGSFLSIVFVLLDLYN